MSERGSFVTEYIYCDKCFDAAQQVLVYNDKFLKGVAIPHWNGGSKPHPIIAGKIGETYLGGELDVFELELCPELSRKICHPMRIAVLADNGEEKIFHVQPLRGQS